MERPKVGDKWWISMIIAIVCFVGACIVGDIDCVGNVGSAAAEVTNNDGGMGKW
jgi:hypothetical protein